MLIKKVSNLTTLAEPEHNGKILSSGCNKKLYIATDIFTLKA